jgi:hypothetical protein
VTETPNRYLRVQFTEQQIALLDKLREDYPPGTTLEKVLVALFREHVAHALGNEAVIR